MIFKKDLTGTWSFWDDVKLFGRFLGFIILILSLIAALFLTVMWALWHFYLLIVPYFFGASVNIHSDWYHVVYPNYWMFAGAWLLIGFVLNIFR